MVKKTQPTDTHRQTPADAAPAPLSDAIQDSAQQIWLAGLGAFAKAQEEGSKAFEVLVKEGLEIQRKSQAVAEQRLAEATHRITDMATDMATGITAKATGQWDKLENIFEDRVAKSLHKLGVPSARDMAQLEQRMDLLSEAVRQLSQSAATASRTDAPSTPEPSSTPRARKTTD